MNASGKMVKGRTNLLINYPFFGSLALRLHIREDPTHKSMWTDGEFLGYNPEYVSRLTLEQTSGIIAHEVMHCALQHFSRENSRDHGKWNYATDYAINPILINSGFSLPSTALYRERFSDWSAEKIYRYLPPGDYEKELDGEVRPGQPSSSSVTNWKIAAAQSATQAKSMGNLPEALHGFLLKLCHPQINWVEILRNFLSQSCKSDYCFSKPNSRYLHTGFILPSLHSKNLENVVIAIDTSASISEEDLSMFRTEVSLILEEYNTDITVLYCNTSIQKVDRFSSQDLPLKLDFKRGGGTDFNPVFDWIEKESEPISCLIYFTDLLGKSPKASPDFPVLWILRKPSAEYIPPFGQVVTFY